MSVPPITFEDGVIFTLTYEDGNTTDVVLAKSVTAERNKVHIVPTLQGDPYNGHEYVDLGLPSGLKWATCNVGATKPEECGDYFAWADTEPYYGIPWVPDTRLAWLHPGERVLTASQNRSYTANSNLYIENMHMGGGMDARALADAMSAENRRISAGFGS